LDSIKKNFSLENYEIIVADSQTEEDTELMMREEYPEIKFFPFKANVGFQELVKKGISESQGNFFLILNGDIIVRKDSIEKMLEFLKSHDEIGIIGPQLINFNETLQPSCFKFYSPLTIIYRRTFLGRLSFAQKKLNEFLMKDFDHQEPKEVDWLMGSALMTSRAAVEKTGLLDKRYKMCRFLILFLKQSKKPAQLMFQWFMFRHCLHMKLQLKLFAQIYHLFISLPKKYRFLTLQEFYRLPKRKTFGFWDRLQSVQFHLVKEKSVRLADPFRIKFFLKAQWV